MPITEEQAKQVVAIETELEACDVAIAAAQAAIDAGAIAKRPSVELEGGPASQLIYDRVLTKDASEAFLKDWLGRLQTIRAGWAAALAAVGN